MNMSVCVCFMYFKETELWVDVRKINGIWTIGGSRNLTDFEADWAPGYPRGEINKDCAYMDRNAK